MKRKNSILYFFPDTWQITKRNLIKYKRVPELLFFSSFQPIMFLLLMNYVFGGAISGNGETGKYINFLIPGIIIQSSIFGAIQTGIGLSEDFGKGIIDRFRTLPISRPAVLAGRILADSIRNLFVLTLMLLVGLLMGFRPEFNILTLAVAAVISILLGFAFSWISATIGTNITDPETSQVANFIWVFPVVFASSVYVPTQTMPDGLRFVAEHSPVTIAVNATRELLLNAHYTNDIWQSVLWSIGIVLVFGVLATLSYKRA